MDKWKCIICGSCTTQKLEIIRGASRRLDMPNLRSIKESIKKVK